MVQIYSNTFTNNSSTSLAVIFHWNMKQIELKDNDDIANYIIINNDINDNFVKLILIRFIEKMMTLTVLFHDNNNDMKAIIITMYDNMMMLKLIESDDNDGWIDVIIMFVFSRAMMTMMLL